MNTITQNMFRNPVSRDGEQSETSVAAHKHCQDTISSLWQSHSSLWQSNQAGLDNQDYFATLKKILNVRNNAGIDSFFNNNTTIDADLGGILKILEEFAKIIDESSFSLELQDNNNDTIAKCEEMNPLISSNKAYILNNIGKKITITVDSSAPKTFQTVSGEDEDIQITLEKKNLSFTSNGRTLGTANVVMNDDAAIELEDNNFLAVDDDFDYILIDGKHSIFKVDALDSYTPTIKITHEYNAKDSGVLQWEIHVHNSSEVSIEFSVPDTIYIVDEDAQEQSGSTEGTEENGENGTENNGESGGNEQQPIQSANEAMIQEITQGEFEQYTGDPSERFVIVHLDENNQVEKGKTSVFKFRFDLNERKLIYGFEYQF